MSNGLDSLLPPILAQIVNEMPPEDLAKLFIEIAAILAIAKIVDILSKRYVEFKTAQINATSAENIAKINATSMERLAETLAGIAEGNNTTIVKLIETFDKINQRFTDLTEAFAEVTKWNAANDNKELKREDTQDITEEKNSQTKLDLQ